MDISIFNRDFEFHAKSKTPLPRKNASYNSPVRLTSRAMIQSQLREREEKASFRVPWDSGVCIWGVEGFKHCNPFPKRLLFLT